METAEHAQPVVAVGPSWRRERARQEFGTNTPEYVCTVYLPHAAPDDLITYTWERMGTAGHAGPEVLCEESASPSQYPATDTYWHPLPGPLPSGAYRCRVRLNEAAVGTAPFAVVAHPDIDGEK